MKINKFIPLILLLTLALFILSSISVFAIERETVLYQEEELKDLEEIKERIKLEITDDSKFKLEEGDINLKKKFKTNSRESEALENEEELKILEIGSTSQKIKTVKLKNGEIREDYVGTGLITIGKEDKNVTCNASTKPSNSILTKLLDFLTPISYAGSASEEDSDPSHGVIFEVKLYYSKVGSLYDITKGRVKIIDHQDTTIKITRMLNRIGSGMIARESDGSLIGARNKVYDEEKTSTTSFGTGSYVSVEDDNDYWFDLNVQGNFIGSYGEIELKRGTSSEWTADLNVVKGSPIDWSPSTGR